MLFRSEGKVRVKGQSAYSTEDFERAIPVVKPAALQSWAHALDDQFVRPGARLQELMTEHKCTFVAFSPLAQGRLLDKFDPSKPPTFEPGIFIAGGNSGRVHRVRMSDELRGADPDAITLPGTTTFQSGLTVSPSGDVVYVADISGNRIHRIVFATTTFTTIDLPANTRPGAMTLSPDEIGRAHV